MTGSTPSTSSIAEPAKTAVTETVSTRSTLAGLCWGMLAVALWAGSFILTRLGVKTTLNPYDIIALRFGFAGLLMLPLFLRCLPVMKKLGGSGLTALVIGTGAPYALLVSVGLKFAPASQAAALVPGFMTAAVALAGAALFGQKLNGTQWLSVLIIVAGSLLISGASAGGEQSIGHALFLCAAIFWASYVLVQRRAALPAAQATAISAVLSLLLYLPAYALLLPHGIANAPWHDIILQMVYQGGITTIVGLYAFTQALRLLGSTTGSALSSLIPVVTLVMGALFLGETPGVSDVIAAALITGGVAALSLSRRKA